ncbi:hypothetical protein MASR2M15_17730 [Anaerolineales bacterium]
MSEHKKTTARERQQKRKETRSHLKSTGGRERQIKKPTASQKPKLKLPTNRWLYLIPVGAIVLLAVIFALAAFKDEEADAHPNSIWLNANWTHEDRSDEDLANLVQKLKSNNVGTIYAYVSSLKEDGNWGGKSAFDSRFSEVQNTVEVFQKRIKQLYPEANILGWIEVQASLPDYRLDKPQVQNSIADMSSRLINSMGFDGVMVDIKPIFENGNEDFISILRAVRSKIGLQSILAVSVPADLAPSKGNLKLPEGFATTEWSKEYKQRVAIQADHMVVAAYHSYQSDPVDYINWVAYQTESFGEAVGDMELETKVLIGIPAYAAVLPAHDPKIESIAAALDGVSIGKSALGASDTVIQGVAIFTDHELSDDEWYQYREKWLDFLSKISSG